jgi:hypothetical protein
MATIRKETQIGTSAEAAWHMIRDVGNAHHVFRGVLTDCKIEGDTRKATFANGMVATERIVAVDDDLMRLAYTVVEGPFEHHSASIRICKDGEDGCVFIWTSDFLPDRLDAMVAPLMELGAAAAQAALQD